MNLAFTMRNHPPIPLQRLVPLARNHGFSGLAVGGAVLGGTEPGVHRHGRGELKAALDAEGLDLVCIDGGTRFSMQSGRARREQEDLLVSYVELAYDLGCPAVGTYIGTFPEPIEPERVYDYAASSLLSVAEAVRDSGVSILLENRESFSSADALKPLLDRLDGERFGVLWNMPHSFRSGESLEHTAEVFSGKIGFVHLSDERYDDDGSELVCPPGRGVMPIPECRDILLDRGYRGFFSLEWERDHRSGKNPVLEYLDAFTSLMKKEVR